MQSPSVIPNLFRNSVLKQILKQVQDDKEKVSFRPPSPESIKPIGF
jgi:hypothetical protein